MGIGERIALDLTAAMKARDALRTGTLRMAKAALKNREIERLGPLDDAESGRVLHSLVKQREDSAQQFRAAGRPELAEKEEAEAALLKAYLPQEATEAEIAAALQKAIAETGAASARDMGRVMKAALQELQATGRSVDGKKVSEAARKRLGG